MLNRVSCQVSCDTARAIRSTWRQRFCRCRTATSRRMAWRWTCGASASSCSSCCQAIHPSARCLPPSLQLRSTIRSSAASYDHDIFAALGECCSQTTMWMRCCLRRSAAASTMLMTPSGTAYQSRFVLLTSSTLACRLLVRGCASCSMEVETTMTAVSSCAYSGVNTLRASL